MLALFFLITTVIAKPLQEATVYFRYNNVTDFRAGKECVPFKPIDNYTLCQKCQVKKDLTVEVNGTAGAYVFLELYTVNPLEISSAELGRYGYGFESYYRIHARLDKFKEDYLLTSNMWKFIDSPCSQAYCNFVLLELVLGFETH